MKIKSRDHFLNLYVTFKYFSLQYLSMICSINFGVNFEYKSKNGLLEWSLKFKPDVIPTDSFALIGINEWASVVSVSLVLSWSSRFLLFFFLNFNFIIVRNKKVCMYPYKTQNWEIISNWNFTQVQSTFQLTNAGYEFEEFCLWDKVVT